MMQRRMSYLRACGGNPSLSRTNHTQQYMNWRSHALERLAYRMPDNFDAPHSSGTTLDRRQLDRMLRCLSDFRQNVADHDLLAT
jgi:hypothetical protein